MDPQIPVSSFTSRNIVEHANERVDVALRFWEWSELTLTEERAFRTIWNVTRQFLKSGSDGKPDELFYLGTGFVPGGEFGTGYGYYKVKSDAVTDPPVGTLPTNATYFEVLDPVDRYIALDQVCKRPIGEAIAMWNSNPRTNGCAQSVRFRQSDKGIDVLGYCGNTVFLKYKIRLDKFTMVPFIGTKNYVIGDLVYQQSTGECYRAIANSLAQDPPNTVYWRQCLFPEIFSHYVKAASYADKLLETDNKENDPVKLQIRNTKAANALNEANDALQEQVDALLRQGNGFTYSFRKCRWHGLLGPSDTVTTLTDECDDDGFIPPPAQPASGLLYFPDVVSLKTTTPKLVSKSSIGFAIGSMAVISTGQHFILKAGTSNEADPGQGKPDDWNAGSHNVYWEEVL